jgi:hypothetical protein
MRDKEMRDETTPNEPKQRPKWGLFRPFNVPNAFNGWII